MFSSGKMMFSLTIRLSVLFVCNYLLPPVEAVNGVIWSKNGSDFVKIFSIRSFAEINKQRLLISQEIETHDFNGKILKFTSFPIENLVNFISNDTEVTGVHGDVWQLLAKLSNFKIQSIKLDRYEYGTRSKNGSWNGVIGHVYRNETDIIPRNVIAPSRLSALELTLACWKSTYRFYIKNQMQNRQAWMIELFTRKLWLSTVGIFLALTLASFSIHLLNFKDKKTRDSVSNFGDHFFHIFAIFCNQGWSPQQFEKRSKILMLSTRLFAWLLIIALSSTLISHIAEKKFHPPFNDLESFYRDTDYKLLVQANSFIYSTFQTPYQPIFKKIFNSGRLIAMNTLDAESKICNGRYAYLEVQDVMDARMLTRCCDIVYIGKPYFSTGIAAGLIRGFKYGRTIDLGILKLHEYGLINRARSKWLKKMTAIKISQQSESISFDHVSIMFAMLGSAVLLSILILLIEKICYIDAAARYRRRR